MYQDKLIPRLGGLHVSMNFLKALGYHMNGSGLDVVWGEMGLLGPGAVELVLAGKAYNKAMRAHKLTLQALWRLLMPSLLYLLQRRMRTVMLVFQGWLLITIPELITFLDQDKFRKLLAGFVESRSGVVNFTFWWQYMDMVAILLQYTRAQRDGIWEFHLYSFSMMLPYFKRYDHLNYGRWGPVYLVEMDQLPEHVLSEFKRGNIVVKRSAHKFSQVDPDQAMEWINGTGKKGGGIIGITKTTSALFRWTLSFNPRSHIVELTHEMYSLYRGSTDLHNEATKSRQKRDNDDESSLMSTFLGFSVFSSVSHPDTLQNLVTKDLATEVIQESLLHAKVLGQQEVKKFVQDRLIVAEQCDKPDVSIYEPVRKNNAPTFATLYQVVKHTKGRDQKTVMKADRNVLRRLITSNEAGRSVDLSSVLKH